MKSPIDQSPRKPATAGMVESAIADNAVAGNERLLDTERRRFLKSAVTLSGAALFLGSRSLRTLASAGFQAGAATPSDSGSNSASPGESTEQTPSSSDESTTDGGREIILPPAAGGQLPELSQICTINGRRMLDDFGHLQQKDAPDILDRLLKELTGEQLKRNTWKRFFRPDDIIGIKFDPLSADRLGTDLVLARALVVSLAESGFKSKQIMLIDPPPQVGQLSTRFSPLPLKLHPTPHGYQKEPLQVNNQNQTHLSRSLAQVTALINVTSIKDHRQLGLACAMSNMALGMINNPGAFTGDNGNPGVAELAALKEIGGKHRLTIISAIQGVYDRGPRVEADAGNVWGQPCIMIASDVVAADAKALEMLNATRQAHDLPTLEDAGRPPKYLAAAEKMKLGHFRSGRIRTRHLSF